jgi:glutamine amidotransferase
LTNVITIVDYGVGNIGSLVNMLEFLGINVEISSCPTEINLAEKIILPGVGAFDTAMTSLESRKLIHPLNQAVLERKTPVLGICLGMQLLARKSEEGILPGLGWIDGVVKRIDPGGDAMLKIPHVGWAYTEPRAMVGIFKGFTVQPRFYHVHSFHLICNNESDVSARIFYGSSLCVAVSRGNVHGVQFHPEKSHKFGMKILKNFAEITP